jgi:hypothetical protein
MSWRELTKMLNGPVLEDTARSPLAGRNNHPARDGYAVAGGRPFFRAGERVPNGEVAANMPVVIGLP